MVAGCCVHSALGIYFQRLQTTSQYTLLLHLQGTTISGENEASCYYPISTILESYNSIASAILPLTLV